MTIEDVARRANVSTATVSRTINSPHRVHPGTAAIVLEAIRDLNFHPDRNAQALGTGRSKLLGLIISDITNPFFPELVRAFEAIAVEHGQEIFVANTDYDPRRMEQCVSRMLQRKVDGVAIMTSEIDRVLVDSFSNQRVPLVFLDIGEPSLGISTIHIDYAQGVGLAIEHLVGLGHTDIGFISGPLQLPSAQKRRSAFLSALNERQLAINPSWIQQGDHRMEGGAEAMVRILAASEHPTAILASNDLTAIGAISSIRAHGLSVPGDISMIGFDDIQLSAYTQPPLSTVRLPRTEIAQLAFHAIFRPPNNQKLPLQEGTVTHVQPTLLLRASTTQASRTHASTAHASPARGLKRGR